jgi:LysR family transcriptional regulator for metE and metH
VQRAELGQKVLITYPVEQGRLNIFSQFLIPAGAGVKKHGVIETTEIRLQMVSAGRGVSALDFVPGNCAPIIKSTLYISPNSLAR